MGIYLHICTYSFFCMCLSVCMYLWRAAEGSGTLGGTGIIGGFEPPNLGAGNQTRSPWQRNHLCSPLLLLSFTSEISDFLISPQTLLIQPLAWAQPL